ncbi:MAG: hypothetical protein IPJ37_20165 [Bacteroidales bacterium]|nr:hypothetical protein [Bacteroidales bacterium]
MNVPVPVPSEVLVTKSTVGLAVVDQQIPLAVTAAPPSVEIFPPEAAVLNEIAETAVVARVGTTSSLVVTDTSFPYAVPTLLVAYALM